MSDECQMRNLHAARARVIIHFKEGRRRKRERRAGAGVSDDVRFAFWRRERGRGAQRGSAVVIST